MGVSKERYRSDPEYRNRILESNKRWREQNPEKVALLKKKYPYKYYPLAPDKKAANNRRFRYGLPDEEFQKLLKKQDGKCAICDKDITGKKEAHVDHCHKSKEVRGLLCAVCNRAIGLLKEDVSILRRAIEYLTTGVK